MPALIFRTATKNDTSAIIALLSGEQLPVDDVARHLGEFRVVERHSTRDSRILACGCVEQCDDLGLLRSLVTAEDQRNQGLASKLLQKLVEHAQACNYSSLYLLTETAAGYFEQKGFIQIQRDSAPEAIRQTEQFGQLCPDSATLMRLKLD